jgi:hypothetical protein
MPASPDPLAARAAALRSRLLTHTPADSVEAQAVQREVGWLEAVEELSGRLTSLGRAHAAGMVGASEEWANGLNGDEGCRELT